jgi:uncharacterized protein (TIGR02453 family)
MQKTTIDFLKNLKKNNNREWFEQNRAKYEAAKEDFLSLVDYGIQYLGTLDSRYLDLKPKDCIFRINRDVRFSNDKSPYKTNMGAAFHTGGKKSGDAAFYFHLQPGASFVGGGLWHPEADKLKKVRQEIDYQLDAFKKIVLKKDFINTFGELSAEDKLKNVPKGYEVENKAAEYLKLKSFVAAKSLHDDDLLESSPEKIIQQSFKAINPFIQFLNNALHD